MNGRRRTPTRTERAEGAVASAVGDIGGVPARWTGPLHVPLPGQGRVLRVNDLLGLARRLAG
ncbi:hypothetical protein AB0F77_26995 [Streptomyces sp. NPDC026672]|uniref:hypothetical protein n=1 Tax=unclassified Streptomyces TaxID=2593676 RepID=UPI0033C4EDE3